MENKTREVAEMLTLRHLMKQFPTGILSIVSDTFNIWNVLKKDGILAFLKKEILARNGKIVIRPDSGDPVNIICGTKLAAYRNGIAGKCRTDWTDEDKGVIELLWDLFGGTINEQGYKVLNPHIGAIYGDSITLDRAKQITERLKAKGFASTNVVLGIGSYSYQYVTRDTHGFAMKATYIEIEEKGREIFKDPVTGDGTKKSAKGLLKVEKQYDSIDEAVYVLKDKVSWKEEESGFLQTIFENGDFHNTTTLTEIRAKINTL